MELLDQPDIKIAYTPTDDKANIIRIPKLISLITELVFNGIKPQTAIPKVSAKIGEKKYRNILTWLGINISFEKSFIPSASGCKRP